MVTGIPKSAIIALACVLFLSAQPATASDDAIAWAAAKESGTSDAVYAFIEKHPESDLINEAKAHMIDVLWLELSAAPKPKAPVPEATPAAVAAISFTTPLTDAAPEIVGKSFEELIVGIPLYSPVEGLPEAYWQNAQCSSCHEWQQENLCTQANFYLTDAGANNLSKQHPYGGSFKVNLKNWASAGCE